MRLKCGCGQTNLFCIFSTGELSRFWHLMYNDFFLCERNSSYNSISIFLKLSRCFVHGPKMCMWFGRYRRIVFFFQIVNLVVLRHLRYNDWVLFELNCSYSYIPIFLKLCRSFVHGLKM